MTTHQTAEPSGRLQLTLLLTILTVAALFRLPALDRIPNGFFLDEASRGYDAYSLLLTGADQYGVPWPLFAEGLDDYTPTLYTLLVIPSVALLGLTETAVRLPAAVGGIVTVGMVFLCGRQLFGPTVGLVSALLVAISPWHILPSRTGAEWALLPLVITAGLWLLARGRTHGPSLALAGGVLGVGLYSYAFARLLVPLLLLGFAALWWREMLARWRWALAGTFTLAALAVPLAQFGMTPAGQARLQAVVPLDRYRGLAIVPYALGNWASYFGPGFLILGAEPADHHRLAGFGPVLWIMIPLTLAGLVGAIRSPGRPALFVLWWIVAAPASAALHRESPSSALMLGAVGSWHVLAGFGMVRLLAWTQGHRLLRLGLAGAMLLGVALTSILVARALFQEYPRYAADDWLYGSRDAIAFAEAWRADYDGVLVSDRLPTPHILTMFYTRADPATYHQQPIHVRQPNVRSRGQIGPYHFGRTDDLLDLPGKYLVWLPANEARQYFRDQRPLLTIVLPDGQPWMQVYETDRS